MLCSNLFRCQRTVKPSQRSVITMFMTAELNFAVASVEDVGFTNSDNLDGKSSTELDGD